MRSLRFFFTLYSVSLLAMACDPSGDTGLPPVGSQPEDGRTIDQITGLPPSRGDEISPPKLPAQSFPTTSNGYLTLLRVDSMELNFFTPPDLK
ncbi:MAG: hypothetical protein IPK68_12985 [Bdellovibrionales bacterium]|nr:hypothetical protein [Bdellovibrionales bacterium]